MSQNKGLRYLSPNGNGKIIRAGSIVRQFVALIDKVKELQ
jgi:hypothetical protein